MWAADIGTTPQRTFSLNIPLIEKDTRHWCSTTSRSSSFSHESWFGLDFCSYFKRNFSTPSADTMFSLLPPPMIKLQSLLPQVILVWKTLDLHQFSMVGSIGACLTQCMNKKYPSPLPSISTWGFSWELGFCYWASSTSCPLVKTSFFCDTWMHLLNLHRRSMKVYYCLCDLQELWQ